jgi:hypothetical protein
MKFAPKFIIAADEVGSGETTEQDLKKKKKKKTANHSIGTVILGFS